jgi:hypothetical protein
MSMVGLEEVMGFGLVEFCFVFSRIFVYFQRFNEMQVVEFPEQEHYVT